MVGAAPYAPGEILSAADDVHLNASQHRSFFNRIGSGLRDEREEGEVPERHSNPQNSRPPGPAASLSSPAKLPTLAAPQDGHPAIPEMPEGVSLAEENYSGARPSLSPPLPLSSSSTLSTFRRRISTASDRSSTSLQSDIGLHLIQSASAEHPVADLILVHGLGGSWMKTWSWNHDVNIFWPSWLRSDDVLSRLRVFSFGYNANYLGSKNSSGILDFAKTLLFNMDGYNDESGTIGQVSSGSTFKYEQRSC